VATILLTFSQQSVYQARATYIVRLTPLLQDDRSLITGLDTLSKRTEIATTFAEVADSRLVKAQAADALGLNQNQRSNLTVDSRLRAGTNILEISVEGLNSELVSDFANAVGASTVSYIQNLYEAYQLEPLDPAIAPRNPVRPNRTLNLVLGGVIGLVLGIGLAFLSDYLWSPEETTANFGIIDDETGAHNKRYFSMRLRQEMSRAKRNQYPLSIALMNVDYRGTIDISLPQVRREALRKITTLLEPHLREEDIMAHLDDTVFAFLLPDMAQEQARSAVEALRNRLGFTPIELSNSGLKLELHSAAGLVSFGGNGSGQEELLAQAARALTESENGASGKVCVFSEIEAQH
jgi:diguanylate cyclase (GGDEF)-like protein